MTKLQANEIKRVINKDNNYTTYYTSKKEELRVRVYTYLDREVAEGLPINEKQKEKISELLRILKDNGIKSNYKIEKKRYQGFINDIDVILY